jgi:aspartyl protease family protein
MWNFVLIAVFALAMAAITPQLIQRMGMPHGAAPAPQAMTAQPAPSSTPAASYSSRSLTVRADRRGHFLVDARVDGRRMDFLVDTGATVIAIPEREAARLGIHPARRDYTAQIRTANGIIHGAPTRLGMVEVGGLTVRDVEAVIMRDGALGQNLLGMSFLSRLRRFEFANGRLVLEQ